MDASLFRDRWDFKDAFPHRVQRRPEIAGHGPAGVRGCVELPVDEDLFYRALQQKNAESASTRDSGKRETLNFEGTTNG